MSDSISNGDSADLAQLHQALVDQLVQRKLIATPSVEAAFRSVPRHLFLPDVPPAQVYQDQAIPTKHDNGQPISSSSQPAIMAIMLEQLAVAPGQRVLEIGAGTGYNAALLANLAGPDGQVVTLDIDADIVGDARSHLAAAGYRHVVVAQHDGALGYPPLAPYDRILLTVGTWDIVPAWREQLAREGRLVLPLTILPGLMLSVALEPVDDEFHSVSALPCGFMPLRGASAHPPIGQWPQPRITVVPKTAQQASGTIEVSVEKDWTTSTIRWSI